MGIDIKTIQNWSLKMTDAVKRALRHVRNFHPEVCQVSFDSEGRWLYMDKLSGAPTFGQEINVGILEAAADSLESLPATFVVDQQ